ncbi:hypothetical protein ALC57_12543 [Trachymyrmex cornetzi]|uniref:Uncharacterized protein n=1 Tax=Trachymyrmex cornetzi TaxID=471704 RepID=A0A151J142_9HYME|nr:hypothetical protein ALC57_12543 [Trachymyrmex cornetzi]
MVTEFFVIFLFSCSRIKQVPFFSTQYRDEIVVGKKYDCARMIEHVSRETTTQQRAQRIAIRGRQQHYRCWEQAI